MHRNTKKRIIVFISSLFFIFIGSLLIAEAKYNPQEQKILILENKIKMNTESLEAVRRDQINYKIEKDLLKEAYSSNIEKINKMIAIALGTIAILGFFGVKSIDTIKKDFKGELKDFKGERDKLISLRSEFKNKMREFDEQFLDSKKRLQTQDDQVMARALIGERSFAKALEYINAGLSISDKDLILLSQKAVCLFKMGRFPESIDAHKTFISIYPDNIGVISSLIELYMLAGKPRNAHSLMEEHSTAVIENYGPYFKWYISALDLFMYGDNETKLYDWLVQQPAAVTEEKAQRISGWIYEEALSVINNMSTKPGYKKIKSAISYLQGSISLEEFNQKIS